MPSSISFGADIVQVKGHIIIGANAGERLTFLERATTLWLQSNGPESISTAPSDRKLQGDYLWPFTVSLPKEVVLPVASKNTQETFRLPQTFTERHASASIQYDINLRLVRGKLRPDYRYVFLTILCCCLPIVFLTFMRF